MRKPRLLRCLATGSLACAAAFSLPREAGAQTSDPDTLATPPNVLLLVDSSGSMEWTSGGHVAPKCDPTQSNTPSSTVNEKSRWIDLLEVLTGTIEDYRCFAQSRSSNDFRDEFSLGTVKPADFGYEEAYHRPLSHLCAPGAGDNPWFGAGGNPYDFQGTGLQAIRFRPFVAGGMDLTTECTTFKQPWNDGLLDAYEGDIRFGLMTFDTNPDSGTGVISGVVDHINGVRGTWSYYLTPTSGCKNPDTSGTACKSGSQANPQGCCLGGPWDCTTPAPMEVGARNGAAPPWEGKMVPFGPWTPPDADGRTRKSRIEQVLLATRPYGATPIAAQLSDARDYLWSDPAADSPWKDQLVIDGCRNNYIILLSDGEPNLDLRPECENAGDDTQCPFQLAEDIADDLVTSTAHPKVRTFVVGFAIGAIPTASGSVDCAKMTPGEEAALCNPPASPEASACCQLNAIAYKGTPDDGSRDTSEFNHALYPKTPQELRGALSKIFAQFLSTVTGRTFPISASASASDSTSRGYEFSSGANVRAAGLWKGVLNRKRLICDTATNEAVPDPVTPSLGDDFIANVNSEPDSRTLYTVEPENDGGVFADRSIRPFIVGKFDNASGDDGVGDYSGTQVPFNSASVSPEAVQVASASWCVGPASGCRTSLVDWAAGVTTATPVSRCPAVGDADCSVVGDIFHSVPQVRSGVPSELLRDESYAQFSVSLAKRDTVLYTSSNDGFFHAFRVSPGDPTNPATPVVDQLKNNEIWGFVPPAVLPKFLTMYPLTGSPLNRIPALDGVPVIRDVAATQGGTRALDTNCGAGERCYPFRLERVGTPGVGESHTFRTVVVQSFGPLQGGYFAVDITKPTPVAGDATTGPKFLWQLTTDAAGNQLFGRAGATPLITTIFLKQGSITREVAVAVLPGGLGDTPTDPPNWSCANAGAALDRSTTDTPAARTSVRCYADDPSKPGTKNSTAARSLTFVRLDTGEIIRTFRPKGVTQPVTFTTGANTVVTDFTWDKDGTATDLDIPAPIVGQPVAFPVQAGQIADRVFVGDAEGRIWRVDVSNPDPAEWAMNVLFDAYHGQDTGTGLPVPQPAQTPPVLSVDGQGQITLAFSTGDQDTLTPGSEQATFVESLTEVLDLSGGVSLDGTRKFKVALNWEQKFDGGKRVTGPMTLFSRTLYFSTFLQASGAGTGCGSLGTSEVWGMDYLLPADAGDPFSGGKETFTKLNYPDVVIFGVGLRQLPSCGGTTTLDDGADDFLGYGKMTTTTGVTPGKFELVIQKGGGSSSTPGGGIATDTMPLATPSTPVRIDSWAPILE